MKAVHVMTATDHFIDFKLRANGLGGSGLMAGMELDRVIEELERRCSANIAARSSTTRTRTKRGALKVWCRR